MDLTKLIRRRKADRDGEQKAGLKQPLFQEWQRRNPEIEGYVQPTRWFIILQFIIRALKDFDQQAAEDFLDHHLPGLLDKSLSETAATTALMDLRELLSDYVAEETPFDSEIRNLRLARLDSLFKLIVNRLSVLLPKEAPSPPAPDIIVPPPLEPPASVTDDISQLIEATVTIPPLQRLAFHIEGSRFRGACETNESFLKWTGLNQSEALPNPDWQHLIHPEDYKRISSQVTEFAHRRQPLYELKYRLRKADDNWQHVQEMGRIVYDPSGLPSQCTGLVIPLNGEDGQQLQNFPRRALLEEIIAPEEDFVMAISPEGNLQYLSARLQQHLPNYSEAAFGNPARPFPEALGQSNRLIAENFWEAYTRDPQPGQKFLLKLDQSTQQPPVTLEFTACELPDTFPNQQIILFGSPLQSRQQLSQMSARLQLLSEISRDFHQIKDLNVFYKQMLAHIQRLIPRAQAAAILIRTPHGYTYGIGNGYDQQNLTKKLLLTRSLSFSPKETNSTDYLIEDPDIHNEIAGNLQLRDINDNDDTHFSPGGQLLGAIRIRNIAHTILQIGVTDGGRAFDDTDRLLLAYVVQQASFALHHHLTAYKLQENEVNYCALLEQSPLAIFILQQDQLKLYNQKFINLLQIRDKDDFNGDIWLNVHPEDLAAVKEKIAESGRNPGENELEFRLLDSQRQTINCLGIFTQIQYNRKPAVICEILDITRQRRLENQLLQAQKMETLGTLATGIAHDFNNILGTIIPGAQLIANAPDAPETSIRADIIYKMARRAASLTQQLLSYAQLNEEQAIICNLNGVVLEARELFESTIGPNIQVHYALEDGLPNITGDRNQYTQMLLNLVVNARDAMPDGGEIYISTRQTAVAAEQGKNQQLPAGKYLELIVRDTGEGIPREIRRKIFQPFFSTKTDAVGSGMGLSIVYGILKKHGGYILLKSSKGEGSAFKIYLPLSKQVKQEIDKPPAATSTETDSPAKTVFIIDDEENLRDVLKGMLKLEGHQHLEADSGKSALQLYKAHQDKIDLIILDYGLKDMNGREVFQGLRKINPTANVMICSGYGKQHEVLTLIQEYGLPFMPKPFTLEMLTAKLKSLFSLNETDAE